jgi:hypothetical protein
MEIRIVRAFTREDEEAMLSVRREVLGHEMGADPSELELPAVATALNLIARDESSGRPVATLSVIDTSGQDDLHERVGLSFDPNARVARYTQLAVLKPFRGRMIPLQLILEGHRLFVEPGRFDHTWLLFDAERATSSRLCRVLEFTPGSLTLHSQIGPTIALTRDERASRCREAMFRAQETVERLTAVPALLAATPLNSGR